MKKRAIHWIDNMETSIKDYLFVYPEREEVDLHLSIINSKALFGIRVFSFVYLTAIYIWTLSQMKSFFQNVEYLTLVGYFGSWLYFSLILQDYYFNARHTLTAPKSHSLKLHIEVLYQITLCIELPITLVFWTILFKILLDSPTATAGMIALNVNLHAGPLACLLLQLFFNKYSFPKRHLLPVALLEIFYLLLNLIYSLQVNPIYSPITWIDWQSYIIAIGTIVISIALHFLCRVIYRKWKIHKKGDQPHTQSLLNTTSQQSIQIKSNIEEHSSRQNGTVNKQMDL